MVEPKQTADKGMHERHGLHIRYVFAVVIKGQLDLKMWENLESNLPVCLVEIGLTDLPKSGCAMVAPPAPTGLQTLKKKKIFLTLRW